MSLVLPFVVMEPQTASLGDWNWTLPRLLMLQMNPAQQAAQCRENVDSSLEPAHLDQLVGKALSVKLLSYAKTCLKLAMPPLLPQAGTCPAAAQTAYRHAHSCHSEASSNHHQSAHWSGRLCTAGQGTPVTNSPRTSATGLQRSTALKLTAVIRLRLHEADR